MIRIRTTLADDSPFILEIASGEPLFSPQEADTVGELLQDYLHRPDHNGYYFMTAEANGAVAGFACYGPTPLTHGTYDLYWICVEAGQKGQGVGRALMQAVIEQLHQLAGRLLVLDTSGRPDYAPTRAFYERLGFRRTAVIPEFYAPGDDLIIYCLEVSRAEQRKTA
jgi:ribosomal protein S18 acetylase RimI-like enzyme